MIDIDDWWVLQLFEGAKNLACAYDKEDFYTADLLEEQLNAEYGVQWSVIEFADLGGALLSRQAPSSKDRHEQYK